MENIEKGLNFYQKISAIQIKLKAPKNQVNQHMRYKYRSCEDILNAVKPYLDKHQLVLTISDDLIMQGDRFYIKASVKITDGENKLSSTGFAREPQIKKGMDDAQITGSCSSYARKYALNGLFCIDDTNDSDYLNDRSSQQTIALISSSQLSELEDLIALASDNQEDGEQLKSKICQGYKIKDMSKLPKHNFLAVQKRLLEIKDEKSKK